jgi:hypothetical protein
LRPGDDLYLDTSSVPNPQPCGLDYVPRTTRTS